MRRKRLLLALAALSVGLVLAFANPAGAQEEGGARDRPRGRGVHPHPRGRRGDRRLPGGAEPAAARDERDHLGRHRLRRWCSSSSGSSACRRCKHGDERPHREDPRRPRRPPRPSGPRPTALLADYRAQLADAKAEAGRIIEEARQAADQIKRDQEARLQAELAELRTRAVADIDAAKAQAMADLRGEVAAAGHRRRRDRRAAQPRPGDPDPARRGLHQPGGRERS